MFTIQDSKTLQQALPPPPNTNLVISLLVLYTNFQLLENKGKEQSDSTRRQ